MKRPFEQASEAKIQVSNEKTPGCLGCIGFIVHIVHSSHSEKGVCTADFVDSALRVNLFNKSLGCITGMK